MTRVPPHGRLWHAVAAAAAYVVLTIAMTWPVARGMTRDVPADLGDSLLNMWILAWDSTQLRAMLGGDLGRAATFFHANIFYPEPFTLAYSEHLVGQALQILPLYSLTGNPILCYNVLFLSAFVLSGLGTYLFVRDLTGHAGAAFVAGLLFAFAPYRFAQISHLQVISSQWMPFVLFGLRRYFDTRRRRALAGGTAALVAQSLSCGYYLLYFSPFVIVYALWEIGSRRLWRDARIWRHLSAAAVIAVLVMAPFFLPYLQVRERLGVGRQMAEIARYSADVFSYWTASPNSRMWGSVARPHPKPEGDLFPGLTSLGLAVAAIAAWGVRAWRTGRKAGHGAAGERPWLMRTLLAVALLHLALAAGVVFQRRLGLDVGPISMSARNVTRLLVIAMAATAAAAWISQRVRSALRQALGEPEACMLVIVASAWWLSLGPEPTVLGSPLNLFAPYALLFDYVPGFDGIRVPARLAMVVSLGLSVLAGLALCRVRRSTAAVMLVVSAAFLAEASVTPTVNGMTPLQDVVTPEARVYPPRLAPPLYQEVRRLPEGAVLIELPLGHPDYDVRATYYSTVHWRRVVNGYSGFFPPDYARLKALLRDVTRDEAAEALRETGATHAVVHEGAYLGGEGPAVSAWLRRAGAVERFRHGTDALFDLPADKQP